MNQSYGAILLLSFVVVACETPRPVDPFEDLNA